MSQLNFHKYKLTKKNITLVDRAMTVAAVLHPLLTVPQIWKIYANGSAHDISLATWLMYMLLGLVFLAYGLVHQVKPLILTQVLWFAVDAVIIIGIIIYG